MSSIIAWLVARGIGGKWASRIAWAGAGVVALLGVTAAVAIYLNARDARVRSAAIKTEVAADAEAKVNSAEDRAYDAIRNVLNSTERTEAIDKAIASENAKPPEQRAVLSPQEMSLACARLRQWYTAEELAEMAAYKEKCQ